MAEAGPPLLSALAIAANLPGAIQFVTSLESVIKTSKDMEYITAWNALTEVLLLTDKVNFRSSEYLSSREFLRSNISLDDILPCIEAIEIIVNRLLPCDTLIFSPSHAVDYSVDLFSVCKGTGRMVMEFTRGEDKVNKLGREILANLIRKQRLICSNIAGFIYKLCHIHSESELNEANNKTANPEIFRRIRVKHSRIEEIRFPAFESRTAPASLWRKMDSIDNWRSFLTNAPDGNLCTMCWETNFEGSDMEFCFIDCCNHIFCEFCIERGFLEPIDAFCPGIACVKPIHYWASKKTFLLYKDSGVEPYKDPNV